MYSDMPRPLTAQERSGDSDAVSSLPAQSVLTAEMQLTDEEAALLGERHLLTNREKRHLDRRIRHCCQLIRESLT